MKRILFALILVCCATSILFAQSKTRMSAEEYANKQKAFITARAKLLPHEAEAFFPLYFEFQQSKWKINKEARKNVKWEKGVEPTEEEWNKFVYEKAEAKIKIAKLEKTYIEKYLQILPARKILDIQRAEDAFQREIIKNMTRHQHQKEEKKKD